MLDGQFVVFCIGQEEYAVPIWQVREIISYTVPTKIPLSMEGILGVINLRGKILPIIDLGEKIGIKGYKRLDEQKIIVMEDKEGAFGAIVDDVEDVIRIQKENIHKISEDICKGNKYMIGIAKQDNRLIAIVDLNLFWGKCLNEIYD
jgi:purine-binding chemotaxis protein CheW